MQKRKITLFLCMLMICLIFAACEKDSASTSLPSTETNSTMAAEPTNPVTTSPIEVTPTTTAPNVTQPTEPVHVHTWSEWETTKEATCAIAGSRQRNCSCGETEIETTPTLKHTEVVDAAVEPTCSESGLTEGKHCSVCGEVTVAQTPLPANGHVYGDWIVTQEPTCTAPGTKACTCACGESMTETISQLAHTEVTDAALEPTCTETGLTEGKHCSVCGEVIIAQNTIPVKEHIYGEWAITQEPTCAILGSKTRTCTCGKTETETIGKTAHTEVVDPAVEPSCSKTGLTEGAHCNVCGEVTVAQSIIPTTDHNYQNGVCACGALEHCGSLIYLDNLPLTSFLWSNGEIICGEIEEDCYYVYNIYGEYLAGPYDGMKCPNPDGYVIAWNRTWEIVETIFDEDFGEYIDVEHSVTNAYLIDPKGNIIYTVTGEWTDDVWTRTYKGEYLEYCNDERIITVSWHTYYMPTMGNECTVHIRDMKGNLIADIENVREFSCMIDGKMIVYSWDYIAVVDKDGSILAQIDSLYEEYPEHYFWPESVGNNHHRVYFTEGYIPVNFGNVALLFSETGENNYLLDPSYLYNLRNYGTLMFCKVYNAEGELSEHYYLIDIAKCTTDSTGMVIPTLDAAVSSEPLLLGDFRNFFGTEEMYMVVETLDGKYGFMSRDGYIHQRYDDVTGYAGGYTMVQEGNEIYVIDENFNRVSEIITGYDSISSCGEGMFILRKGDSAYVYIFTP